MPTVTSKDGTLIAFDKLGSGSAVILVDGAMGYRAHWGSSPLAAALANEFTVYTYDRRGRGESGDTQPYAVAREIDDIEALIDHAGGSAFLFGTSSGAALALQAAAALGSDKVTKLALYEPPYSSSPQEVEQFAAYTEQFDELLHAGRYDQAVEQFLSDMMSPDDLALLRQSPDWALLTVVAPTLAYDNVVLGDSAVPTALARRITIPALILSGDNSPPFFHAVIDALHQAMPNAQRQILANQTHAPSPQDLAPELAAFFKA
jgi:pimeloyl-ACP methyl ester carboxylesterase